MNKRKLLTIPMEIYQREFDLALYMALVATEKGFQVLLGAQNDKIFKKTRNGIYYHKDHANWSEPLYRSAMERGMKTCALDVEGLIYQSPEIYIDNRANKWILENIDIVFAWGENQKKLIKAKSDNDDNIIVVGSPKFDVCELEKRTYSEHKTNCKARRILINTRFPNINEISPGMTINALKTMGIIETEEEIKEYKKSLNSDKLILGEFTKFIELIAKNRDVEITIRPHPAESDVFYKNIASNYTNVQVDRTSDLRTQILSHDCLIHDGCTTAIEARALGKPVFSLRPSNLNNAYSDYANKYSLNFESADQLYYYLLDNNISNYNMPDVSHIALESIHNWEGLNNLATYKIVEEFNRLQISPQNIVRSYKYNTFSLRETLYLCTERHDILYTFFKIILGKKFADFFKGYKTMNHKFSILNMDDIIQKIKYYNYIDANNTSLLEDLSLIRISKKSILLYKTSL